MKLGFAAPLCKRPLLALFISFAVVTCSTCAASGQATMAGSTGPGTSRVDIFGGYGYFYPFNSDIANIKYPSVPLGAVGSLAGYFTKHLGLQVEGNYFPHGPDDNNCVYTAQAGPILRAQRGRLIPFFHALGGGAIVGGPRAQGCNVWGWGATGGFGLDIIMPIAHDHLALRPIQTDFMYSQINNGPLAGGGFTGGLGQIYAFRLSGGLVLRFGDTVRNSPSGEGLSCAVDPGDPYPGDPVTVTSSTTNISPKRHLTYVWTTTAGHIAGNGPTAAVDTSSLSAGVYEVSGKALEGTKQKPVATCATSFTVRSYEPPTVACAADRAAINSGDTVAITATARSPQGRQLTYSYTTTGGMISGNGPTASLTTAGVTPGNITVTCRVADDRGHTAEAATAIAVATPAPPSAAAAPTVAAGQVEPLCTITFDRDKRRPDRVDNEGKGCLDDVALALNRNPDAKLLMVGSHATRETNRNAAERAMNAAQYLTDEKGVDPARLDLRIGPDASRAVSIMLIPPGAVVEAGTATSFDTSSVKRSGQPYGKTAAAPAKKRKKKPAMRAPLTY